MVYYAIAVTLTARSFELFFGSRCGCSASVLCAYLLPKLEKQGGNVLFASTGALMSPITFLQKESIPAIAHIVNLTA